MTTCRCAALVLMASTICVSPAQALVPASLRVQKLFADAGAVFSAKVAAVNPDKRILDLEPAAKIKGTLPGAPMRCFLKDVPEAAKLLSGLKAGDRAMVLVIHDGGGSPTGGMLHVGDTWLRVAPPAPGGKVWLTGRDVVLPGSYPGRTETLELFLKDLADGKDKYLNDEIDVHLPGLIKPDLVDLGTLGVKPTAVTVGKVAGKIALLVRTESGEQNFVWNGKALESGPAAGFQPDVSAEKTAARKAAPGETALTGDWLAKPGVIIVSTNRIALYPLSEDKPDDLIRFTGIPQPKSDRKIVAASAGDFNGDGRTDLYLAIDDGNDWVVINRGYGCFFPHNQPTIIRRKDWTVGGNPVPAPAFVAAGDFGSGKLDLLYIAADGKLTVLRKPFVK